MRAVLLPLVVLGLAGCGSLPPAPEASGLSFSVDGGSRQTATSMSTIRGTPASRSVDVWLEVQPPACDDPALLLTNATALGAAEAGGRALDVTRRPYGLLPLPAGERLPVHLSLTGRVDRAQGRLLLGCGNELVTRWLLLDLGQMLVGGTLLIMGAFGVVAALVRARRALYGWLALFLLSVGWVCFAQSPGFRNLIFVAPAWVSWLRDLLAFGYVLAFARWHAVAFGDTRRKLFTRAAVVTGALAAAVVILDLARVVGIRQSFVIAQLLALGLLPVAIAHVLGRARAGDRAARRFLSGTIALLAFAAPDLFWGLGLPWHFELNTAPIGLLLFAAALGSIVELEYETREAELEARIRELEGKQREIHGLSGELRHQIGQRSRDLGRALLRGGALGSVGVARLEPGRALGRYRVVRELGAGAMGAVYQVERQSDGRALALKVMSAAAGPALAARFAREAEIAARVQHPNVVAISDFDVLPSGLPFLVMELVRGGSLEDQRRRFGDVPWALAALSELAAGLEALHQAGVVHRDLKPSNVLIDEDGRVKVADFGIAREQATTLDATQAVGATSEEPAHAATAAADRPLAARLTHTGALIGTPLYMAPELGAGGVATTSSDVFAFGLIARELLGAGHPFPKPVVLLAMAGAPLPSPPPLAVAGLSEELVALLDAAIAVEPERRPSARLLALALEHARGASRGA